MTHYLCDFCGRNNGRLALPKVRVPDTEVSTTEWEICSYCFRQLLAYIKQMRAKP